MSGFLTPHLFCDGAEPDCLDNANTGDLAPGTLGGLRRRAREDGWLVALPGGRDLCPVCRRQVSR